MKEALSGSAVLLSPIYDLWQQAHLIETEQMFKLSYMW
jgi:hypothetical protein